MTNFIYWSKYKQLFNFSRIEGKGEKMNNFLNFALVVFSFYLLIGFVLGVRYFNKKTVAVEKTEERRFEAILMITVWPIFYPLWMRELKNPKNKEK